MKPAMCGHQNPFRRFNSHTTNNLTETEEGFRRCVSGWIARHRLTQKVAASFLDISATTLSRYLRGQLSLSTAATATIIAGMRRFDDLDALERAKRVDAAVLYAETSSPRARWRRTSAPSALELTRAVFAVRQQVETHDEEIGGMSVRLARLETTLAPLLSTWQPAAAA